MNSQIKTLSFLLLCFGLGALGYFVTSWATSPADVESSHFAQISTHDATEHNADASPAGLGAEAVESSVPVRDALRDTEELSLLSSALNPGFVEYLYTARIQAELDEDDVEMIETRLLAELPPYEGDKYQDPREAELAARHAVLRALHKAHAGAGVKAGLVARLATLYKKVIVSSQDALYLKAQALRNLAVIGIGVDELERDQFLRDVDPRIHRLAAMDEIQALGTEE